MAGEEMAVGKTKKNRLLTVFALVFLFAVRWMFYRLELDTQIDTLLFVLEGALFLLVFGLCLFRVPGLISASCLFAGCVALGVYYGVKGDAGRLEFLLPLTYFPALLFLIDQYGAADGEKRSGAANALSFIMQGYPLLYLCVLLYAVIKNRLAFSRENLYSLLLFVLVGVCYVLIMRSREQTKGKGKKKGKKAENGDGMRTSFLAAVIVMAETGVFFLACSQITLSHTVPILWIVDILLLADAGHPPVCAFFAAARQKTAGFLSNAAPSDG